MARGPFQGSFQPNLRQTVVTAPDAIVYFNGGAEIAGCPDCNRTFDFNKFITSITIDLSVDSVPGSASIQMAVPRHTVDDFMFNGNPVIQPMMEVEIYAKGYYLLEGIPQYYPVFWGLVTEVNDAYSSGAHTVSISCADILKWWEVCKMNINPALTSPSPKGLSLFGNTFSGMNPYDIIWSLAQQSYGDVVVGTGSLITLYREQNQKSTFDLALSDLMLYWESRFQSIRNGLLLYGTNGVAVRGDTLYSTYQRAIGTNGKPPPANYVSTAVRNANGGPDQGQTVFDPTSPGVVAFRTNYSNIQVNLWQSEFQTKLELATAAKEVIGYEFFMDVDGSIVFKPPFYNLDILSNKPISWIQDIDIIDWDFSESEAEVVTQVIMQGSFAGTIDLGVGQELTPFSSVTDYHLLRKYGWRSQTYNSEFLADPQLMFYHGLDLLDRFNSRRHRGTVTIPMRPELRLGFPVYIAPKDQIWYVSGISHNIAFGGRATTTLTLTAKREKFVGIKGMTTLSVKDMNAGTTPAVAPGSKGPGTTSSVTAITPTVAFPYSSRQLSAQANFVLNLGTNPAFLPAINSSDSATDPTNNPYQAIVCTDPATGLLLGYPNVVMVYAQPFASANTNLDNLNSTSGQKNPGTNPATQKSQQQKITNTQQQNFAKQQIQLLDETTTQLREKHIVNRYTYGLTSAGRFVYAHDAGGPAGANPNGVIGEILTFPQAHFTVTPETTQLFVSPKTVLVRPVSDERGFEVVGHFKYGRRVSLTDGSLVLTGNTNTTANVDSQLGLGGNLYAMLQSQSQGISTVTSAYPNPAQAVATLQPTDLSTAGVVQPDNSLSPPAPGSNQFVGPSGYNALGSPQQAGSPPSVQATNLARALTLSEMVVQDQGPGSFPGSPTSAGCTCQLQGRSGDFQFLQVGYSVQPTGGSGTGAVITGVAAADLTTLGNSLPGAPVSSTLGSGPNTSPLQQSLNNQIQIVQALQAQLDAVQARANSIDMVTNPIGWAAAQQTITNLQSQVDQAQQVQTSIEEQIQVSQSIGGQTALPGSFPANGSVLAMAETFLANLYQVLDVPHQQLEHTLRGDYMPGGALNQPANFLNDGATSTTPLAPPFSPATAAALGNPVAGVIAGASNAMNLTQTWNQFGQQLQSSAQRTVLQQQISSNQAQLTSIQSQISALQQQTMTQGQSVVVAGGQTAAQTIAALQTQAQQLQQQITNAQAQLAQLPTPPTGGAPTLTNVPT
jgi:hypothetical protein